jgi:hypothetical protein
MLMGLVRSRRAVASARDTDADSDTKPPLPRRRKAPRPPAPPKPAAPATDPVADAIRAVPNWRDPATNVGTAAIAKATGVARKTVQRRLARMRAACGKT